MQPFRNALFAAGDAQGGWAPPPSDSGQVVLDFAGNYYFAVDTSYPALAAVPGYACARAGVAGAAHPGGVQFFAADEPMLTPIGYHGYRAATNAVLDSGALEAASWNPWATQITASDGTAPDGSATARLMIESAGASPHALNTSAALGVAAGPVTLSLFAKATAQPRPLTMTLSGSPGLATFDLAAGAIVATAGTATASMTGCGNGWFRCVLEVNASGGEQLYLWFNPAANAAWDAYTGDGQSGLWLWQVQALAGSFADGGPVLPTAGAAVTGGASSLSVAAADGLYNATYLLHDDLSRTVPLTVGGGTLTIPTVDALDGHPLKRVVLNPA